MVIAQQAAERTALYVVVALAAIGRTRRRIPLRPIPVQDTAVEVGVVVAAPVLAAVGRVGRLQVRQ